MCNDLLTSVIEKLLNSKGTVYILGHESLDIDSFTSGIYLESILLKNGISAEFVTLDKSFSTEVLKLDEYLNFGLCSRMRCVEDLEAGNILLVDHHINNLSLNIVGYIDHKSEEKLGLYDIEIAGLYPSCMYMLFGLFSSEKYLTKVIAEMLVCATITDTVFFKSSKSNKQCEKDITRWAKEFNISISEIFNNYFCIDVYSDDTGTLAFKNSKAFSIDDKLFRFSYIFVKEQDLLRNMQIVKYIQNSILNKNSSGYIFLVSDLATGTTRTYFIKGSGISVGKRDFIVSFSKDCLPILNQYSNSGYFLTYS